MHRVHNFSRFSRSGVLLLAAIGLTYAGAAASGNFSLRSSTVDGGGQHSQGARFAVEGTVGQPDTARLSSNRFSVAGGFWPAPTAISDTIFANRFED